MTGSMYLFVFYGKIKRRLPQGDGSATPLSFGKEVKIKKTSELANRLSKRKSLIKSIHMYSVPIPNYSWG